VNKDHTYQQKLLRKYIDGSISQEERHELEKMALDDPFLFDAIEAYSTEEKTVDHQNRINEIHDSLKKEKKKRRIIPLSWISAAAGILLVGVIGFLIREDGLHTNEQIYAKTESSSSAESSQTVAEVFQEEESLEEDLAMTKEMDRALNTTGNVDDIGLDISQELQETTPGPIAQNKSMNKTVSRRSVQKPRSKEELSAAKRNKKKAPIEANQSTEDVSNTPPPATTAEEIRSLPTKSISEIAATSAGLSTSDGDDEISIRGSRGNATNIYVDGVRVSASGIPESETEFENSEGVKEESIESDAIASAPMAKSKSTGKVSNSTTRTIKGKVIDETGEGIIGASVYALTNELATFTDFDGNFELHVPNEEVSIKTSFIGYEPDLRTVDINENEFIIELKENSVALESVMIVEAQYAYNQNAQPLNGHEAFKEYLSENIVVPDNCTRDQVLLEFTITIDGDLKNITSETKDDCFYEAQRLLIDGGKWKTIPPRNELTIKYVVYMR
jgi:hypothetical protein